jgi:hypothetical protein
LAEVKASNSPEVFLSIFHLIPTSRDPSGKLLGCNTASLILPEMQEFVRCRERRYNKGNMKTTRNKIIFLVLLFSLISAGCQRVVLYKDVPSVPKESYEPLPR